MLLSKISLPFRVYIPPLLGVPSTERLSSMNECPLFFLFCKCELEQKRIGRNNLSMNLYQRLSRHSLSLHKKKKKKQHWPNPAEKPVSEMFCSPSKLIRLSVEHEPSTNTHPAVISMLSHFAFVKFCILGLYESGALTWQGYDVQNSNLFLRLCAGWGGRLALK